MNLVGRTREIDLLDSCLYSGRPEFVAVYGRRRVGKTHLIREYFKDGFAFYATGIAGGKTRDQLKAFNLKLQEYGSRERTIPSDWFEAFSRLQSLLQNGNVIRDRASGRIVVFLDELPWLDTARSDFKPALDFFWNGWASAQPEIMLIVCGSATSWIITNLIDDRGGFHNRITRQISLAPFTLAECEEYCRTNGITFTRQIKNALGISGVETSESAWQSGKSNPGAQVDLVIDRADGIVNLCEMKFSNAEFSIDKSYDEALRNKLSAFRLETGTKKALHVTLVTSNGLAHNKYWNTVQNEITADDLFA
ncbi:MAG: ATP-binding protein [Eggerthellaceae bacterium]|nr:ATP-binding protein [Eggerthellaceae bacterium]